MRFVAAFLLILFSNLAFAGYDLHITRKPHWADEVGPKIAISEWHEYLKRDRQLSRDKQNSENDFVVSLPNESFPIWFDPKLGELTTKNPSEAAIKKLIEMSKNLKARVQGDDGETYPRKP